jgi:superfamily II DNA/RNA helicase/HKD family nuclease
MNTDLTFFTNEPDQALIDRFKSTLKSVQFFDVIVGYFRTSGFYLMKDALEDVDKIRILVGLDVDKRTYEILEESKILPELDFESHTKTKRIICKQVEVEFEESEDRKEVEDGVRTFIKFLTTDCRNKEEDLKRKGNGKKLEIKAYPSKDLHAKVYISRFHKEDRDFGRVITGSSNFSERGLQGNLEFNVELKQRTDVEYALVKFETLWKDAVDISQEYIDTIKKKTWVNDNIKPYELYLKMLFEYFKEDINIDQEVDPHLPDGFMKLEYQQQAVVSAKKILDAYNGVFLADVVGLGKTFISAMLAQALPQGKLIICPPVLKEYWEQTMYEFSVSKFKVESLGKLDNILREGTDQYDYIFIDEAHRFRNEYTQGFEKLHQICLGKKVVLVSATPINNKFDDLFSQIRLFQPARKSTIPGVPNLERFFKRLSNRLSQYEKTDPEYLEAVKEGSEEIRDKILKYIMVRRTRSEITKHFSGDMQRQELSFPEIANPNRFIYQFDEEVGRAFKQTIENLAEFRYARYTPSFFLKYSAQESQLEVGREMAIGGFMKGILVKRLESSFHAFKKTVGRFIDSYHAFIEMFEKGTILVSKKVNVYDLLDEDNEEKIQELIEKGELKKYRSEQFNDDYIDHLKRDLEILQNIRILWEKTDKDPKLETFIHELKNNQNLKGQKVIIFTESKETGEYLQHHLNKVFENSVIFFSSLGGKYKGEMHTRSVGRNLIKENFDPTHREKSDKIKLLVTTDVLAEGINLHRANILINYDLPWNPTRVLQRVGRVNRVGTRHTEVHIYNFFPTDESDKHLGLEANIIAKIQAFHNTLGEDAKYLSDQEEVTTHELFGDNLYKKLNTKATYEGEDADQSELEYLKIIREVRDNDISLFKKIKELPKKARSARKNGRNDHTLITFFRKGKLKKFFGTMGNEPKELTFFEAAEVLKCKKDEPLFSIGNNYFELLAKNKQAFELATTGEDMEPDDKNSGRTNESQIIRRLKAREFRNYDKFTDDDDEYIKALLMAYQHGIVPKNISKKVNKLIKQEPNPIRIFFIIWKESLHKT